MSRLVPHTALAIGLATLFAPATLSCKTLQSSGQRGAENSDATLSPYFWVKSEDASVDALPLKSTLVKAEVSGVIADVKVTQVYRNQGRSPLEAIYVFPGSTRAAVYGMKMTIGTRVIEAKIREKERARQEYEQAKQEGRSASLLEQQRPNVFQMNVANIMPGDEIRVELSYTELLVPTAGIYEFVYPTVVGPRYSNTPVSETKNSEAWVANPYTKQGEAPLSTFDIQVKLAAGLPIDRAVCETHRTDIVYNAPDIASVKLDPTEAQGGNRDFILKYRLSGNRIQSGLLLAKGKEENFFLLQVQPPKALKPAQMPGREYIFIVDVSGSMHGYPLDTAKVLMRDLVSSLRPEDRFNLEVFESGSAIWSPEGSRPGTPENLNQAIAFMGSQHGGGGTEIIPAMKRALTLPRAEGFSRTFVIATDGYISVEPKVLDVIRENLGSANLFAFGIGSSVNRFLIEGMAHAGMGEPFVVTKPEEAASQAERFRNYIAAPALTNVKVSFHGFDAYDVEPKQIPDVFADRPVLCFGKWQGYATGTVEVTGTSGSGAFHQTFQVGEARIAASDAALRNLWARHRIQLLADYAGLGATQPKAVTELGLKYGLLTEYTSFVAIDTEIRNAGGQQTTVKQPLPLPEGVSNLAVAGSASPMMCAPAPAPATQTQTQAYPMKEKKLSKVTRSEEISALRTQQEVSVDTAKGDSRAFGAPTSPLASNLAVTLELRRLLQATQISGLLKNIPAGTVLVLALDANGKILKAHFTKAFKGDAEALAMIKKWTVTDWKGGRQTLHQALRIPLPFKG